MGTLPIRENWNLVWVWIDERLLKALYVPEAKCDVFLSVRG